MDYLIKFCMNFTEIFAGLCPLFKIEYHLFEQAFVCFGSQSARKVLMLEQEIR